MGVLFAACWCLFSYGLGLAESLSPTLRGFVMSALTLALTGGLHMDGLMDTCDAVFSRKDTAEKLKILSDVHAGSFAVIGCVVVMMSKTFLFAELFLRGVEINFLIPIFSRLGMAFMLNNLKFAKSGGLAFIVGASRQKRDNIFLVSFFAVLSFVNNSLIIPAIFILILVMWSRFCLKTFGGITGDLLGAFLEISEILFLVGTVVERCI